MTIFYQIQMAVMLGTGILKHRRLLSASGVIMVS